MSFDVHATIVLEPWFAQNRVLHEYSCVGYRKQVNLGVDSIIIREVGLKSGKIARRAEVGRANRRSVKS